MKNVFVFVLCMVIGAVFGQEIRLVTSKEFQDTLNKEYTNTAESPLMEVDLAKFNGLDFFPIEEQYIVKATFTRAKKEKVFQMKTQQIGCQNTRSMVNYILFFRDKNLD